MEERKITNIFWGWRKLVNHMVLMEKPVGVAIMHGLLYMENAYINMAYPKRTKSKLEYKSSIKSIKEY